MTEQITMACSQAEVESSRTSLALTTSSRTHFEVLGLGLEGQVLDLGLEASSPRKLACPRLEDSTVFWIVKILWSAWKIFWKTFFCGDRLKNFCEDLFFFWRALALVSLVLGLEHSCLWPRECLSSERLSLALASVFFCVLVLGLEPCVLDSTSAHRGSESRTWARDQLKYNGFPVVWTPKQTEKMPRKKNEKKKVFTEILTIFSAEIRWFLKK